MLMPNRFLQSCLKLCLAATLASLNTIGMAQDESSTENASVSSAASSAAAETPIYADTLDRDNALLVKAFTAISKSDELLWLNTPSEKILSLYKISETRKPKGALLILHALDVPQLWPASLENLRRHLPLYGWSTMTMALPSQYPASVPARELPVESQTTDITNEPATDTTPTPPEAAPIDTVSSQTAKPLVARDLLIGERVETALAELNKIGQFNLVILTDNSSAPYALSELYKKINKNNATGDTIDGPLQALILVNLQNQEPLTKEQLGIIFAVGDLPILDVFFNPDNQAQNEQRRLHHAEAMRRNLKDYQQLVLPPQQQPGIDDTRSFWLAKVQGFMVTRAEGNEHSPNGDLALKPVDMK